MRKLNRLSEQNLEEIVTACRKFTEEEGFSRIVDLSEIEKNDFNLNMTLYCYYEEKCEEIDVVTEWKELKKLEQEGKEIEGSLEGIE